MSTLQQVPQLLLLALMRCLVVTGSGLVNQRGDSPKYPARRRPCAGGHYPPVGTYSSCSRSRLSILSPQFGRWPNSGVASLGSQRADAPELPSRPFLPIPLPASLPLSLASLSPGVCESGERRRAFTERPGCGAAALCCRWPPSSPSTHQLHRLA